MAEDSIFLREKTRNCLVTHNQNSFSIISNPDLALIVQYCYDIAYPVGNSSLLYDNNVEQLFLIKFYQF